MTQAANVRSLDRARPWREGIDDDALDVLFRDARSHNGWQDRPVPHHLLEKAVDLAKMGPTSANASPLRILFIESPEAKARLKPALAEGNVEKTMTAPVTAVMAYDLAFYDLLPKLFPHADAFLGNEPLIARTATQNGTLQAAYFLLAVRAVGLDAGPLSGFDNAMVDAEFFAGTTTRSNFIINIGYGDPSKLFGRSPRLDFSEIASFA